MITLKDRIENNPAIVVISLVTFGFTFGVSSVTFLEKREQMLIDRLRIEMKIVEQTESSTCQIVVSEACE